MPQPTIVLDLSGGVLQAAYSTTPIDIIVISHDRDDIIGADPEHIGLTDSGADVYISASAADIEPAVVDHYLQQLKGPTA
jgi:hypothetical protein